MSEITIDTSSEESINDHFYIYPKKTMDEMTSTIEAFFKLKEKLILELDIDISTKEGYGLLHEKCLK